MLQEAHLAEDVAAAVDGELAHAAVALHRGAERAVDHDVERVGGARPRDQRRAPAFTGSSVPMSATMRACAA